MFLKRIKERLIAFVCCDKRDFRPRDTILQVVEHLFCGDLDHFILELTSAQNINTIEYTLNLPIYAVSPADVERDILSLRLTVESVDDLVAATEDVCLVVHIVSDETLRESVDRRVLEEQVGVEVF